MRLFGKFLKRFFFIIIFFKVCVYLFKEKKYCTRLFKKKKDHCNRNQIKVLENIESELNTRISFEHLRGHKYIYAVLQCIYQNKSKQNYVLPYTVVLLFFVRTLTINYVSFHAAIICLCTLRIYLCLGYYYTTAQTHTHIIYTVQCYVYKCYYV